MKGFIPIVIEPYEDELLYSWVYRLSKANGLSLRLFFETYFRQMSIRPRDIPVDMRKGYNYFFDALDCDIDMMELYFQLSTAQFELSFLPTKQQIKVLHNIYRPESKLNSVRQYFFVRPRICLECMKEDIEKYGEYYLHRSHHLSDVVVCHKHHTPLYEATKKSSMEPGYYDFDNLVSLVEDVTEFDRKYSEYTYQLLKNNMSSNSKEVLAIIVKEIMSQPGNESLTRIQIADIIIKFLGNAEHHRRWSDNEVILHPKDTVKVLMHLFPNFQDFMNKLPYYNLIIKKHCDICNKEYYTTQYAIDTGWGCVHCDNLLTEEKLFERLVFIGGNKEYTIKTPFHNLSEKLVLHHKVCGEDFSVVPADFLFKYKRCSCNQKLSDEEINNIMKKHKDFKLIRYKGTGHPAIFRHEKCGEEFELNKFKEFADNPKCRRCEMRQEITQESFEKEVRDLVGDEYTVVGKVKTRLDKIEMRHNVCGHIHEIRVQEFLIGTRCPKCYRTTSTGKLKEILKQYAGDRYEIIGKNGLQVVIYDNETGKEIKMLHKHVVQEIVRPTPSEILPTNNLEVKKSLVIPRKVFSWEEGYRLCIEYKQENGHLYLQNDEVYKQTFLGDWCKTQRLDYIHNSLSEDKIELLKNIDFVFDILFYKWNKRFNEYKQYVNDTGDKLPNYNVVYNDNKIGMWLHTQRDSYNSGKLKPIYAELLLEFEPTCFDER